MERGVNLKRGEAEKQMRAQYLQECGENGQERSGREGGSVRRVGKGVPDV